jgi:hypothetical protein
MLLLSSAQNGGVCLVTFYITRWQRVSPPDVVSCAWSCVVVGVRQPAILRGELNLLTTTFNRASSHKRQIGAEGSNII